MLANQANLPRVANTALLGTDEDVGTRGGETSLASVHAFLTIATVAVCILNVNKYHIL